ncbi:MAG TPA: hypothetical protein VN851_09560 [Thermoanaerobaculia bacterium]|nr:hypothetical protein [Thermoanaerobaculia bacterium]
MNHTRSNRNSLRHLGLCLLLACLGACRSAVTISQLNAQGRPAEGRRVTITGRVVDLAGRSPTGEYWYEIEDAGARIWVSSHHPCPNRGDRLRIEGRVTSEYTNEASVGRHGAIKSRWWSGLGINETRRKLLSSSPSEKP